MRRRTKRRLAVGGAITAALVAGYVFYWPKDTRPKLTAFGSEWALEDLEWAPLFDHYALSFALKLAQGTGEIPASSADLSALCETVLAALPNPPSAQTTRKDVYRITFNVKNKSRLVFDEDIPIGVAGGACLARSLDQEFVHAYPAPLDTWALRTDLDVSLTNSETPEYSFFWGASGEPDLEAFPFEAACTALVMDPPQGLAKATGKRPRTVTIWAEKEIGEVGSGQFTAKTAAFEVADGVCSKVTGS